MTEPRLDSRIDRFLDRLATAQHRCAGTWTLLALVLAAAAVPLVLELGLNSAWTALLPEDEPSVRDLEKVEDRVSGLSTLNVAIQSPNKDVEAMQAFARDLVPRLREISGVSAVEWNIGTYEEFVWKHRHLYADLDDLQQARKKLDERLEYEKSQANPFYVDLEDEEPPDPSAIIDRLKEDAEKDRSKLDKYPGGFYIHPDRDLLVLFVRSDLSGGDAQGAESLIRAVDEEAQALDPSSYSPKMHVGYAGDVVMGLKEHDAIARELAIATALTVSGVLLVIFIFFRRFRAIPLIGASLAVPVIITFGIGELAVDYLNTSTAFLGSIVIGNGINPNIIWLSRFFEERRNGYGVRDGIHRAHRGAWLATLTASLAAAIAYASLIVTDFRGFRDFGIIGGTGMVLCWVGALGVLPAMVALLERVRPMTPRPREAGSRGIYGVVFSKIAHAVPKPITLVSLVLGAVAVGLIGYAIAHDPLEYDFRNLKSVRKEDSPARQLQSRIYDVVDTTMQGNAIAMLVPKRKWTEPIEKKLEKKAGPLWSDVRTIDDLLPSQQKKKKKVLADIRELMLELESYAEGEERKKLKKHLPPEDLETLDASALPASAARPFTERDGTRGRILLIEEAEDHSIWDGKYLMRWAEELREIRLPNGERPPLAGRAPVFADMIRVVWHDGPQAILVSFLATSLLVLVTFRRLGERMLTILALLLGIAWMGGTMTLLGIKLNFLNFVAFPITFGNGVDYGVNVMRRYSWERQQGNPNAVRAAVERTGGAVILCSLTTIIGYTSLYTSANLAINSFGAAMAISEVTCMLAAVLTVPAMLLLWQRRRTSPAPAPAE